MGDVAGLGVEFTADVAGLGVKFTADVAGLGVKFTADVAGLGVEFTAHLGDPGGGSKTDGAPGTLTFDLNPPRLESLASLLASIFLIRLLRPA